MTQEETKKYTEKSQFLDFGLFQVTREQSLLLIFCLVILAIRLVLINLNQGEYTDGIIQISRFVYPEISNYSNLWPPLYSLICTFLFYLGIDLETSAKLVSIISSVAIYFPIYFIAKSTVNSRAAVWCVIIYAVQPMAWRWSIRVMTDTMFVTIFMTSVYFLYRALYETEKQTLFKLRAYVDRTKLTPQSLLAFSILCGILCGLTRYQGVILIPLQLYCLFRMLRKPGQNRVRVLFLPILSMLGWGIIFWLIFSSPHSGQFKDRAGTISQTLINYLNIAESFVYIFPYFVTPPVFIFMVWGLVALGRSKRLIDNQLLIICIFSMVSFLFLQTSFQAFQERYFLPLIPLMAIGAGIAMNSWLVKVKKNNSIVLAILILIVINSIAWSGAVLLLQREAWGDVRKAADHLKSLNLSSRAEIYSPEIYNGRMGIYSAKMEFWSGHKINYLDLQKPENILSFSSNSYVVLHSAYTSRSYYPYFQNALRENYRLRKVAEFNSQLVPLLPDIMEIPNTGQNPMAWFWRYQPQNFSSSIYFIEERKN